MDRFGAAGTGPDCSMILLREQFMKRLATPMKFTLGQAARETGRAKATLSRDIKNGKISATKGENGSYEIEASELFRVYARVTPATSETRSGNTSPNDPQPPETPVETQLLQLEIKRLLELLQTVNLERDRERTQAADQIADLRRRLDGESEERRAMTQRLLTYQPPPTSVLSPPGPYDPQPQKRNPPWWKRGMLKGGAAPYDAPPPPDKTTEEK